MSDKHWGHDHGDDDNGWGKWGDDDDNNGWGKWGDDDDDDDNGWGSGC
jgi:hypothetical protein